MKNLLFGAGKTHEDKALDVKKGDALFLYEKDSDILYGPYTAKGDGRKNIDSKAWRGMYPYQVSVKSSKKVLTVNDFGKCVAFQKIDWRANILDERYVKILNHMLKKNTIATSKLTVPEYTVPKKPSLEATTLWDYPKQSYGSKKGNNKYPGVTPAHVIYNMVKRYTERGDFVVDPMCGSGTTLDVCKEEKRKCIGYDVVPTRKDIRKNDSRKIPLKDNSVDLVFLDSPYGDNIRYNESPHNIGHLSAESDDFYSSMNDVASECARILKPGKTIGWLIGDQWVQKKFTPVSWKIYQIMEQYLMPSDVISVTRRNQASNTGIWHNRALRHNFYLRGFKSLLIFRKPNDEDDSRKRSPQKWQHYDRK